MSGSITINDKRISVVPQWDGIEVRRSNDMIRAATLHYNIIGTTEPQEADSALVQCSEPSILGCLFRSSSSLERKARLLYEGIVEYEYKNTDEFTFAFDTTGGSQHLTQSYQTLGRYAPLGKIAPNHYGAIGVNDRDIAGCDVIMPALSFSMTRTRIGVLDLTFIKLLAGMTGRINATQFLSFLPGEVLFEGASGSQKFTSEDYPSFDVTYKFRISPSIANLATNNIAVGYKRGWDYFWVQYEEVEDEEAHMIAKRPVAAFIERVYLDAELNLLL